MDHRRDSGFTLLELLLVIAIVGILATMSVPIIGRTLKTWRTDQFSRSVLTAHQAARFHAITKKTLIQVRYNMDKEKISFYFCDGVNPDGSCDVSNWQPFRVMSTLTPPNDSVDLWSVGSKRSGEACIYYKPNGTQAGPFDRSGASGDDCPGNTETGTGIHITWVPNPDETKTSNHCKWNTVHHPAQTGKANLLDYGAYPGDGDFSDHSAGDPPPCAS